MSDTSPTPVRVNAAALDRATRAASMRVSGIPWARVATELGYANPQNAMRAVRELYASMPDIDTGTARALLRDRAERVWMQVQLDMKEQRPGATRSAIAVLQRMAQLDGLDAPSRVELYSPTSTEYNAVVADLLALHRDRQGRTAPIEADPFSDEYIEDAEVEEEPEDDPLAPTGHTPE